MLFTSATFVFFIAVFFIFCTGIFLAEILKLQNLLILTGSFIFYAWWDWRFLFYAGRQFNAKLLFRHGDCEGQK